jgi:hypothetical protein
MAVADSVIIGVWVSNTAIMMIDILHILSFTILLVVEQTTLQLLKPIYSNHSYFKSTLPSTPVTYHPA